MAYQLNFAPLYDYWPMLLEGAAFTLLLTAIGTVFGLGLGIVGAVCRAWRIHPIDWLFGVYV